MPSKSSFPERGGRAESLLPNLLHHLRLLEVRIVGEGQMAKTIEISADILGWHVYEDRAVPVTIFGPHKPKDGWHSAILNTVDKSHTELDGTHYPSYIAFMAPKWAAFEKTPVVEQKAKQPVLPSQEPRSSSAPESWKEVRK